MKWLLDFIIPENVAICTSRPLEAAMKVVLGTKSIKSLKKRLIVIVENNVTGFYG